MPRFPLSHSEKEHRHDFLFAGTRICRGRYHGVHGSLAAGHC